MSAMKTALRANIEALETLLKGAAATAAEAREAADRGDMNLAIGTLVAIKETTPQAASILAAAFALHQLAHR